MVTHQKLWWAKNRSKVDCSSTLGIAIKNISHFRGAKKVVKSFHETYGFPCASSFPKRFLKNRWMCTIHSNHSHDSNSTELYASQLEPPLIHVRVLTFWNPSTIHRKYGESGTNGFVFGFSSKHYIYIPHAAHPARAAKLRQVCNLEIGIWLRPDRGVSDMQGHGFNWGGQIVFTLRVGTSNNKPKRTEYSSHKVPYLPTLGTPAIQCFAAGKRR